MYTVISLLGLDVGCQTAFTIFHLNPPHRVVVKLNIAMKFLKDGRVQM